MTKPTSISSLRDGNEIELDASILFIDLVDSSVFASVLDLTSYASYMRTFRDLCIHQCEYFFDSFLKSRYNRGEEYEVNCIGDELVVFLHTGNPDNDVYLLTILAVSIKCAWLGAPFNAQRLQRRTVSSEAAAGINFGKILIRKEGGSIQRYGYAINLTKRIETLSRTGDYYRVFLSDSAFKQINTRMRNLIFGPRQLMSLKGIVGNVGVYELLDSFINPIRRLDPRFRQGFRDVLQDALENNSRDLWIHSSLQVIEEAENGAVTDSALALCRQVLSIDPKNPAALYHLAQGIRERDDAESAALILGDLVRHWPGFGDGWLEYSRVLKDLNRDNEGRRALLRARMLGIDEIDD